MELEYWELNENKDDSSGSQPLDGKTFKLLNVYDNGNGPENKYVGFTNNESRCRAIYGISEGMPVKFYAVPNMPDTY